MGKFNWRGAAQGALGSLYNDLQANREEKRAYERQDREAAIDMAKMLAQQGMPIPSNLQISEEMRTILDQYGKQLPERERAKAAQELLDYTEKRKIDLATSPTMNKAPTISDNLRQVLELNGITLDEYNALSNVDKRSKWKGLSEIKRKESGGASAKESKPRYQIIKDEKSGIWYKLNVDTNEKTVIKEPSEDEKKAKKSKEEREAIKIEQNNSDKATEFYSKWEKSPSKDDPTTIKNYNTVLGLYGYKITPKKKVVEWGADVTNYELEKIGSQPTAAPDPLGIMQ
jgi:hypothetical protein